MWCAIAALCGVADRAPAADGASRLAPFFARVQSAGHAEVRLERRVFDAVAGAQRLTSGRVILEPPARARVDFDGGESVTLRDDGGEWLQPTLHQLVRLGPERARDALAWCDLLLGERSGRIVARDLPDGRVLLLRQETADASDSAWATLDAQGHPTALEFRSAAGESERLRLRHWTFGSARGRKAFVLEAPRGFEVVELR
jgi:outer membrane lipoprotein-sorting protein